MQNGQSAGKSFAYILGVYMGDGCVTKEYDKLLFRLEVMDEDFAMQTYNTLIGMGLHHKFYKIYNERYTKGYSYIVVCRDKELCLKLQEDTEFKTKIPEYIYKGSLEIKKEYIAGMMDSEGFVSVRGKPLANGNQNYQLGIRM